MNRQLRICSQWNLFHANKHYTEKQMGYKYPFFGFLPEFQTTHLSSSWKDYQPMAVLDISIASDGGTMQQSI